MADGHGDPTRNDTLGDEPGDEPQLCSECHTPLADDCSSDGGPPLCFSCAYFEDGGE